MLALRLLARLMLWLALVLVMGLAFAWTWDRADGGGHGGRAGHGDEAGLSIAPTERAH